MYSYTAYGLGIASAVPLPELIPAADVRPDVVIRRGRIGDARVTSTLIQNCAFITADEACFFWEQVGAFLVRHGQEIIVEPVPGVEEQLVRLALLGTVLSVLLHQRGLLVLHASAVAVQGSAVAFLGAKGQGKSTTAATLYGRGHRLVADDVVALDLSATDGPLVLPGFPQFKLLPDAAAWSLGDDPAHLPRVASVVEKHARPARDRFVEHPLPLRCVYLLADGPAPVLKRLQPHAAISPLIAHSFVARFGKQVLHGVGAAAHLRQCTQLLTQVPLYRLERPISLPSLPAMARLVEEQVGQGVAIGQPGGATLVPTGVSSRHW